ncbi:MAG: hypothetical protein EAX90_10170 [Candidatus Heimdallarchaeota archaeon]|nr:hypothetical protein [Candidatus Heimdallarchaeota archaeon]
MGTEPISRKIDLVVMTGSVPFITAGLFQESYTDATLISGALSGMSNMFQEMLNQGELRHSELYNAHIYIRHLTQMNDHTGKVNPDIKQSAQMRVAIIVREGELNREEEIALSEFCYSIMFTICERTDLANKLRKGNIEGYIPSNKETREILAEAIEDYRKRAKRSIFYENPNFLQEKDKFILFPSNNDILEKRIKDFFNWIIEEYYPEYFPKIDFINFFGLNEYIYALKQFKTTISEQILNQEFREKLSSDLFNYIIQEGLMPFVLYSGNVLKRIDIFLEEELENIISIFIENIIKIRGPVGISIHCINYNLRKISQDDKSKIGWYFAKYFLEEINNRPFELPLLKQFVKILEQFNLTEKFFLSIYKASDHPKIPPEYITQFIDVLNTQLSEPFDLEKLTLYDKRKSKPTSDLSNAAKAPSLPPTAIITTMDDTEFLSYCKYKDTLKDELTAHISSLIKNITSDEKEELLQNGLTYDELIDKLFILISELEVNIQKDSTGFLVKSEIDEIFAYINEENYEKAQTLLLNVVESFEALEIPESDFLTQLLQIKEINQKIIAILKQDKPKKKEQKGKTTKTKNITLKLLNEISTDLNDFFKIESYEEISSLIKNSSNIFDKKSKTYFIELVDKLNIQKNKILQAKTDVKTKKNIKDKKKSSMIGNKLTIDRIPKATPESIRIKDELLVNAICNIFNWSHNHLFGKFYLDRKNLPTTTNDGLLFYYISEALTIEIGLIFDIIQSYTNPRTWLIGQLGRIVATVENKISAFNINDEKKYIPEEKISIDVKYVNEQFKKLAKRIIEIINQLESDAQTGKINIENKKSYLETGFLGRTQEVSIPNAKKYLNELKSLNKTLSNKELDFISSATSINFKDLTTNVTSVQLIAVPLPSKEAEFPKILREISSRFKKWNLDLYHALESIFRLRLIIEDTNDISLHKQIIENSLRRIYSDEINNSLEILENSQSERIDFMNSSMIFKDEIFKLIGLKLLSNKPLKTFKDIKFRIVNDKMDYTFNFSPIKPPTVTEQLLQYFILSNEEIETSIIGRKYNYKPFEYDNPNNLTELIISDAFRRSFDTINDGIEIIMKFGKKIHSGIPKLRDEIMKSYNIIQNQISSK